MTLGQVLTQQAVLERDMGTVDAYGASAGSDWQPLATVPCRFWWWRESSRGPARELTSPQRTAGIGDGGLIVGSGLDVTIGDRLSRVLDASGDVVQAGPFDIVAVLAQEGHLEVFVRRT